MKIAKIGLTVLAVAALAAGLPSCKSSTTTPPLTGTIQVTSTPTGAKVFLDGTDKGLMTNCSLTNVSAGNHVIKLTKDGYADYQASATVTGGQTTNFSATLTAVTPGALAVTPATGLAASGNAGGPFTPSSQDYTIQNTGGASINWTAAATQAWVTVAPASGTLAAGATATVSVTINTSANALAVGTHSDTVTFTNVTNGNGNTTRAVGLNALGTSQIVFVTVDYVRVLPMPNPTGADFPVLDWTYPNYVGNLGMAKVADNNFTSPQVRLATETVIHMWIVDDKMFNGTTSTVCATLKINGQLVDVGTATYGEALFIIGNNGVIRKAI